MKKGMKSALVATASLVALTGTMTFPAAAGASSTTTLQLANDKSTWTQAYNALGPVIAKADGGIGWAAQPYPNTTAFQAVVRALRHYLQGPAAVHVVVRPATCAARESGGSRRFDPLRENVGGEVRFEP